MSLWLDMLGTQVRYVPTKTFGSTRIAEAGMHHPALGSLFAEPHRAG